MKALLVVDMIYDFVYGKFGNEAAKSIVPRIRILVERFRANGIVVFLKDSHRPGDAELKVWGQHAMQGTHGSEIIEALKLDENDIIVEKRTYDGFFSTSLSESLKSHSVDEVYICGVATDICVLHTAFGAFIRGFSVLVVRDACASTSYEAHMWALKYMKSIYGAKIVESDDI